MNVLAIIISMMIAYTIGYCLGSQAGKDRQR